MTERPVGLPSEAAIEAACQVFYQACRSGDLRSACGYLDVAAMVRAAFAVDADAVVAARIAALTEDEVTVFMQEWENPRVCTLGEKFRRAFNRIMAARLLRAQGGKT